VGVTAVVETEFVQMLTLAKKGIKELYVALQDEEYAENTSLQWR
jgi:hypothetical protein